MKNIIAPLHDFRNGNSVPKVFGTAFTDAEIAEIEKVWNPLFIETQKLISDTGFRPENHPAMDNLTMISRMLATFKKVRSK